MDQSTKEAVVKLLSDALSELEKGSPKEFALDTFEVGNLIREAGASHPHFVDGVKKFGSSSPFTLIALGMDLEHAVNLIAGVK